MLKTSKAKKWIVTLALALAALTMLGCYAIAILLFVTLVRKPA